MNTLALELLDGFDKHVSSGILLSRGYDNWGEEHCNDPKGLTGLHGIAYLGIVEIVVALSKMNKWDLNATDVADDTAILWAAKKGRGAMVKMLLEHGGITPDTAAKDGRTPLSWAAGKGRGHYANFFRMGRSQYCGWRQ